MRNFILLLIYLILSPLSYAVVPTLSAISTQATKKDGTTTTASSSGTQVLFTSDTTGTYFQVFYDTVCHAVLTDYRGRTKTMQATGTTGALQISGLEPNTTYCYQVTGRPNAENDTDICDDMTCGAPQNMFTTDNEVIPQTPELPTTWVPSVPNTTGYSTVPISQQSGTCKAAANVVNPGGWSGNISIGDSMQTIFNTVAGGDAIIEVPLVGCTWPNAAVVLPTRSGTGGWIMFKSAFDPNKIPPYQSRITPNDQQYIGTITVTTPSSFNATFFDMDVQTPRKYWFQGVAFKIDAASGNYLPFARLTSIVTASGQNLSEIVFDRVLFLGDPDVNQNTALDFSGNNIALVGCWIQNIRRSNDTATAIHLDWRMKATGGPYYFFNNLFNSVGATALNSYEGDPSDAFANDNQTWIMNTFTFGVSNIPSPTGVGGYGNFARSPWELKRAHKVLVKGNLANWWYSNQSAGSCFLTSARSVGQQITAGISDVTFQSNICAHGKSGIEVSNGNPGDNCGLCSEPQPSARFTITNNLFYDLNELTYCPSGGSYLCFGLNSTPIANTPGVQDLVITNNTSGPTYAYAAPGIIYLGQSYNISNYLSMRDNVWYLMRSAFSSGGWGGIFGTWGTNGITFRPPIPAPTFTQGTSPNFDTNLTGAVLQFGASIVTGADWGDNIIIGGEYQTVEGGVYGTMSQSQLNTFAINWPPGDTFPMGATMAARESTIGMNTTTWACSGCGGAGVNLTQLYSDMGRVTNIGTPNPGTVSVTLTYTAPDTRACQLKTSANGGFTWSNYVSDGGGSINRSPIISGLNSGTDYLAKILCYYDQENDGEFYTDYPSDQLTELSFHTIGPGTRFRGNVHIRGNISIQ